MFISLLLVVRVNYGYFDENIIIKVFEISILGEKNLLFIIWKIFQIATIIYFSYLIYSYEVNNSIEFIVLRKSLWKMFVSKFLCTSVCIALFRLIIFFILLMLTKNTLVFNLTLLLTNIVICICFSFISLFIFLIFNYNSLPAKISL